MTRIYQAAPLAVQATLTLDANASHHLARVLRACVGDTVTLFNGNEDGEYNATVSQIDKKNVTVTITTFTPRQVESPIAITLAQGIARGEKMDMIIQKAVELGATTICPLITERCNVRLSGERETKRFEHWQAIAISAAEQSGRCRLPTIYPPQSLADFLSNVHADACFVLSPHVTAKLSTDVSPASIALLIGPEGGLSDQEVAMAQRHCFQPLNLGPRILRTETATIAAISSLQYEFGDFKN